ncbi:type II secretion system F family protein [Candidatus Peregrinibacteria bacterium]|jgi:type IV pilus assembly protein PilC|nr:type II secretion system F family protein [Candidatus Peregrinibacteria bacterium]MBT4367482.1 type II secretion system F family protein [Candidatus Peregrinibacteria bacterium]MBT6731123.1 type II secretion system F family protein [Candidatus Peregrinibacteria bacterium]MBT7009014.1 type II secretion system F family protein [Candidatus Peregrinibacteria bacterium]MBT7345206.1 type II secretion system F family protein [Candidatus Peregrinibacteria bacterium]
MNLISHRKKGRKKKGMKKSILNMQIGRGKMKTNDLLTMLRHLSMTIHAGVPLLKALSILEEDAKGAKKRLLGHLKRSVEAGHKLADAMENAPMKFPDLVVTMVRTGEIGGTLEMSINRVMHRIKRSKELKGKVIGAMMYPVMILSMVTALGLAMGLFVLPQITPLFKSMGAELPLPTRIMMLGSEILQEYYLHMGIGFIVFLIVFILVSKIEIIKYMEHSFLLKIPLLKTVIKFVAIVNLLGTFGSLMQSGVPLKEALENASGATGVRPFRRAFKRMIPMVEEGKTVSDGMRRCGHLFPTFVISLISVGEETGSMTETCDFLAEYCQTEAEHSIKSMLAVLEPVLLIGVGGLVGGAVLAVIAPIYSLTDSF